MEGHDFFSDQPIWLPFESISINTVRQPNARPIFLGSSNGLASGNHISEAILHATCEVIERDALTLWDLCPGELREKRRVNLASISDSELENILNVLDRKGFAIAIWDITTDVTIPTFTCVLLEDPSSDTGVVITCFQDMALIYLRKSLCQEQFMKQYKVV